MNTSLMDVRARQGRVKKGLWAFRMCLISGHSSVSASILRNQAGNKQEADRSVKPRVRCGEN